jgi:hypothetical protein
VQDHKLAISEMNGPKLCQYPKAAQNHDSRQRKTPSRSSLFANRTSALDFTG